MMEGAYRLLLRAYPREFRERFQREMVRAFRDRMREARERGGPWGAAAYAARAAVDALVNGTLERMRSAGAGPGTGRGGGTMGGLGQDLAYAVRTMVRRPGLAAVAVLTLGLGVGADAAIFSVVEGVLLRPLEYPDAERIVVLRDRDRETGRLGDPSAPNVEDWKERASAFESVALVWGGAWALTGEGRDPVRVSGGRASAELFRVLGLEPAVGRFFRPGENRGDPAVVVISHGLWRSRFGGDPGVVGRTLELDGRPREVIGVLPPVPMPRNRASARLTEARGADHVWMPIDEEDPWYGRRTSHFTLALARLADGVAVEEARAELSAIAAVLEEEHPDANAGLGAAVIPLRDEVVGDVRAELLLVLGAVTLVLLVACANLANLLLARAVDRGREMAVRSAMGAGRGRLVRQALTEASLLGIAGAVVGVGVAWLGMDALLALMPRDLPRRAGVGLSATVLAYTLGVAMAASLAAGVLPALRAGRGDIRGALSAGGGRSGAAGSRLGRVRSGLVVGQLALAVLLLAGSGLLLRTLVELRAVDPGVRTERVLSVPYLLSGERYGRGEVNLATHRAIRDAVAALPGVEEAVLAYDLPVETTWYEGFLVSGRPDPEPGQAPVARFRPVGVGYFDALEVSVLRGRPFRADDRLGGRGAVVVNQTLVERYFPGEPALGRRILTGTPRRNFPGAPEEWTIVGVVENVGFTGPRGGTEPALYVPIGQFPVSYLRVLATARVEAASLVEPARRAVWSVDPELPLPDVGPLRERMDQLVARERFVATLAAAFALVALAVAAAGVYGVMSYAVAARRREMGVRLALGAAPERVLAGVLGRGLGLAAAGLALGVAGALALGRVLSSFLYQVRPWDPVVLASVVGVLLLVAAVAGFLPARRAAATDPATALRAE